MFKSLHHKHKFQDSKIRLVYILAPSHSGSTLLAMLLNSHPEICTVGELKITTLGDPSLYRCSCRKMIRDCEFWNGISDDMLQRGFVFDIADAGTDIRTNMDPYVSKLLKPLHRGPFLENIRDLALNLSPTWRNNLDKVLLKNSVLIECVALRLKKKIVVDSSKIGIRLKYLLRNPELDISVIRLIRDGRGVALAYLNPAIFADCQNASLRNGGAGGFLSNEHSSFADASLEWRRSNEEADHLRECLPKEKWFELRYETLCNHPQETLKQIAIFLGVSSTTFSSDFRYKEHHVIGNGMRLDDTSNITLDERWRTHLTTEQLNIFENVAGNMNRKLGYF
ncbi:sulfotransferase [Desulfopila aestuarii]|uniref:Sulfotransferase family protein n=1 Tax=Desulfopila aestuarii DSM 18488 TaxID=1121416 RepID=A0A1M7YFW2_9BACT|nr:sulfotransferase [Desulfopila aestuarii]SHO51459.1 Sulfotransferase family protein [Desulfopila aestuarii DSM 18488]